MGATPIFGGHKTGEILALGAYKMLGNIKLYLWGWGKVRSDFDFCSTL